MNDQRTEPRRKAVSRARIWIGEDQEPLEALVRNVSASGALLQTDRIDIGTEAPTYKPIRLSCS